jgi:hypothetical protein
LIWFCFTALHSSPLIGVNPLGQSNGFHHLRDGL